LRSTWKGESQSINKMHVEFGTTADMYRIWYRCHGTATS
jgi:hypothetical protein